MNTKNKKLSLNEKIKRFTNNHLPKTRFIQAEYNGGLYEISYHKCCFWWQERFSIKEYIKNLYTNHWEVCEVINGSKLYVMGNGSGIIYGFFPKRKMKKQLYVSARYWQQYK